MDSKKTPPPDDSASVMEHVVELPSPSEAEELARYHVEQLRIAIEEAIATMNINRSANATEPTTATQNVEASPGARVATMATERVDVQAPSTATRRAFAPIKRPYTPPRPVFSLERAAFTLDVSPPPDAISSATTRRDVDAAVAASGSATAKEDVKAPPNAGGASTATPHVDITPNASEPAIVTQYVDVPTNINEPEVLTGNGNSAHGMTPDLMRFITRISDAMSKKLVDELTIHEFRLRHSVEPLPQGFTGPQEAIQEWIRDRERKLNALYEDILGEKKLCSLGIDRCIAVSIGPHEGVRPFDPRPVEPPTRTLPSSPTLTTAAEPQMGMESLSAPPPDFRLVIPGKLVQKVAVRSAFQPSKEFTNALLEEFRYSWFRDLVNGGDHVYQTFVRERKLHCHRHALPPGRQVCVFQMAEEDFEWVPDKTKKFLIRMEWDCKECGGHHGIIVTE